MGHLDELRTIFQEVLGTYELAKPYDHGLLGDGQGNLWVPADSDNRVWFRKNGQASQLVKVHCWRVRPVSDLPVICGYTPEQQTFYQVLTCDREMLEGVWQGMSSVPRHAEMHIWGDTLGGDDPVMVWTRALMPFRVSPQATPDFTVQVQGPEMYLWLGTWTRWGGDVNFNLAGDYPGVGLHLYSLVSIDGATNLAQSTPGLAVAVAMAIPPASYPTPPAGCVPVGLVHLVETAAAGNEIGEANILDARILVGGSGGSILPGDHDHSASGGQGGAYIRPAALGVNTVVPDQDGAIAMMEVGADPTNVANVGMFYPKDVGGVTEGFYMDDAGSVIQLTVAGDIRIASLGPIAQGDIIRGVAGPAAATLAAGTLGAILIGDAGGDVISTTTPTFIDLVTIDQNANRVALRIDSENTISEALQVYGHRCAYLRQDITNGYALYASRDLAEAGANPLASFIDENAANTQPTVYISHVGTGPALQFGSATGKNVITIPTALPVGMTIVDTNAVEYLMIDTAPQLAIDLNRAGADIDIYLRSVGVTGLFVQGSDGALTAGGPSMTVPDDWWIGIGAALERIVIDAAGNIRVMGADFGVGIIPVKRLHMYDPAGGVIGRFESGAGTNVGIEFVENNVMKWQIYNNQADDRISFWSTAERVTILAGGNFGIGTIIPDRLLHAEVSDAATNTVTYAQRLGHITSGAAAALFGVGTEHELEDAGGAMQVASETVTLWATATAGAESPLYRGTTYPIGAAGPGYWGFWTWNNLDNNARTIIPNGAGDVTSGVMIMYWLSESGGGVDGNVVMVANSASVNLYDDATDVFTLTVAADGSVTVVRSAGATTADLSLLMCWV